MYSLPKQITGLQLYTRCKTFQLTVVHTNAYHDVKQHTDERKKVWGPSVVKAV